MPATASLCREWLHAERDGAFMCDRGDAGRYAATIATSREPEVIALVDYLIELPVIRIRHIAGRTHVILWIVPGIMQIPHMHLVITEGVTETGIGIE